MSKKAPLNLKIWQFLWSWHGLWYHLHHFLAREQNISIVGVFWASLLNVMSLVEPAFTSRWKISVSLWIRFVIIAKMIATTYNSRRHWLKKKPPSHLDLDLNITLQTSLVENVLVPKSFVISCWTPITLSGIMDWKMLLGLWITRLTQNTMKMSIRLSRTL